MLEKSLKHHNLKLEYDKSIIQKAHGYKVYKDVTVLTPGIWSDMITNAPVLYKDDTLRKYSTNWIERSYVNLGHSHYPLDYVGSVQNQYYNDGVRADLYINENTSNGKDIISKIDSDEINQLSVEMQTVDYWDTIEMMRCAGTITFMGVSIIGIFPGPACSDGKIK